MVETATLIKVVAKGDAVARRRYALDYPCAACRRFKLPFTVPVSGRFAEERVEPSAKRPRRQKNYACSPIHGCTNAISLVRSSAALAPLTVRSFIPRALYARLAIDRTASTSRRFPSFSVEDARLFAAYRCRSSTHENSLPLLYLPSLAARVSFSRHSCSVIRELPFSPFVVIAFVDQRVLARNGWRIALR